MKQNFLHIGKLLFLCALLLFAGSSVIWGQATLPVNRTSNWGSSATGWTASGISHRTTSFACSGNSAATFDNTNDQLMVNFNSAPNQLIFVLKEASMSGNSTLLVERSDNGSSWVTLGAYGTAPGNISITDCGDITHNLTPATRFVRWTYTKATGNCDLDDVRITQATNCPTPSFSAQPVSTSSAVGNTATFTAAAGNVTSYQWQWRTDAAAAWANVTATEGTGGSTNSFTTVAATQSMNGYQYRMIATNACGGGNITTTATSNTATLTVTCPAITITAQPQDQMEAEGGTATFEVTATGSNLVYEWQENDGSGWQPVTGNSNQLTIAPLTASMDGYLYQVTITDDCSNILSSDTVQLSVIYQPVIIVQPVDTLSVAAGQTATFDVTADGNDLSYQWEVSTDNGQSWNTIPGADAASYAVVADNTMNGNQYRVNVSNSQGAVVSDAGTINVIVPTPVQLISFDVAAQNNKVLMTWTTAMESNNRGFEVERSSNGIEWKTIVNVASEATNGNSTELNRYTAEDEAPLNGLNIYRLKQVDRDGRSSLSEVRKIQIDRDNAILIYPNPAQHILFIKGIEQAEQVRIINVNGHVVKTAISVNEINIADLAAGLYIVQIVIDGKPVADRKLVIAK